jgi:hypothetical protein
VRGTSPRTGKPCRIYEPEQGPIEIRCQGTLLPSRIFHDKNPHVRQGAIVENKRLASVLTKIRDDQRERDRRRLASRRRSLRDKERIREAQGELTTPENGAARPTRHLYFAQAPTSPAAAGRR